MARPPLAVAKGRENDVRVSGGYFSINGTEPQRVPADLRHLDEMTIARELLRRYCGETDDEDAQGSAR